MKKFSFLVLLSVFSLSLFSGNVEKTFQTGDYTIKTVGQYQTIAFDNALLSGIPGEPTLPYFKVFLMLPPGESAESIEILPENEITIEGSFQLFPKQNVVPISKGNYGNFLKNETVYRSNTSYPSKPEGHLLTQYLNGFGFALSTFTPVRYNPATGKLSYYSKVTVRIRTKKDPAAVEALLNLSPSENVLTRVRMVTQNPEMILQYSSPEKKKSGYQMLIITPTAFEDFFTDLITYYSSIGLVAQMVSTEDISAGGTGIDMQEKIRNYIRQEYQAAGIEYVLLGGSEEWVPSRKFYDIVYYNGTIDSVEEESYDIPADIYYSGLDGSDDANGNGIYGEIADSTDLLPDVAVGRFPFSTPADLISMVHKSVSYQADPVLGEFHRPLLAGEYLYDAPLTFGGDYMDLLINDHSDNGYYTHGIPSSSNTITKLYDNLSWEWGSDSLLSIINSGTSFIHHLGHAATSYMLRFYIDQITDANFSQVNGIIHNYSLIYTQGCDDGSFDQPDCISTKSLAINNFAVAGIFNTRFGWFDQGTTDGPSEHLQREFVSALFNDTLPEHHIGTTHMISKIKTAPWIGLPSEFENGAQRWTHYDCTLLGDPALWIYTEDPAPFIVPVKTAASFTSIYPNPSQGHLSVLFSIPETSDVKLQVMDATGQSVSGFEWKSQDPGKHRYSIDLTNLAPGLYNCRLETNKTVQTKKIVLIR